MEHRILILGPQGSGKGTQANMLAEHLGIPALSMGNLLREEVASGSELGKTIASYIDDGNLVPDDMTSKLLKQRLAKADAKNGFILDGYPRFMEQYEASEAFLNPTSLLVIDVPEEESMKRILKRAEIEGRVDDTPEAIQTRLAWSREKTQPVIDAYKEQGIANVIDGMGSVEDVQRRVRLALGIE